MTDVRALVREVYSSLAELDDDEFISTSRRRLAGQDTSAVLAAIFLEFPSSLASGVLTNLGFWFETITYDDVVKAMLAVGDTYLPAYHFAQVVPEILGVDVRQAALDVQRQRPEQAARVQVFVNLPQPGGPSRHALTYLRDAGASPERIRDSLRRSGAPLLPLPDPA